MRIEENRVFMFTFDTGEMGNIAIPVRSDSREGAAASLQAMFARMQTELAIEFPKVVPARDAQAAASGPEISAGVALDGLSEILLERINKLMADLGGKDLVGEAKDKTIQNWTELDFVPVNYPAIVHKLELMVSGAEELPVKGKKK